MTKALRRYLQAAKAKHMLNDVDRYIFSIYRQSRRKSAKIAHLKNLQNRSDRELKRENDTHYALKVLGETHLCNYEDQPEQARHLASTMVEAADKSQRPLVVHLGELLKVIYSMEWLRNRLSRETFRSLSFEEEDSASDSIPNEGEAVPDAVSAPGVSDHDEPGDDGASPEAPADAISVDGHVPQQGNNDGSR